jgi:hypothetical protein
LAWLSYANESSLGRNENLPAAWAHKGVSPGIDRFHPWLKLFFAKISFSGFLLGNRKKIAVVANANFSLLSAKMAECLTYKHRPCRAVAFGEGGLSHDLSGA